MTPGATHDRKCFPDLALLKGKLTIFDFGYCDYGLLLFINNIEGFFSLCLKFNAVISVTEAVQWLLKLAIRPSLLSLYFSRKRGNIIEVIIEKYYKGETLRCRAIGFWNPAEWVYRWYRTNLAVALIWFILYIGSDGGLNLFSRRVKTRSMQTEWRLRTRMSLKVYWLLKLYLSWVRIRYWVV